MYGVFLVECQVTFLPGKKKRALVPRRKGGLGFVGLKGGSPGRKLGSMYQTVFYFITTYGEEW